MKGQINIIYIGILTLISIAVFGTILIWNFSVSESTSNEFNEKQMEIIATQISEDINYLSTFDKNSVYTIKKDLPSTIGEDNYCIRLNQDESGNKRIYISKKGNSLSYNSFKKTDFYIDFNNKELNFENSISCGGKTNIVKTQNSIELTTSLTSAATIVDAPPTISTIIDTSTNEDTSKDITFTVSDENLASLALSAISGNTTLVNQTANGGLIIPSASGSSRTLTINPNNNQNGIVEINITATDGSSQTDIESFNLTINSVDDGPTTPTVIYSPSSNRKVGDSLTCVASSTDPEGDSISYSYQFRNGSESGTIIQDFSSDNTIDSISATYAHEAIYCIAYATSNSIDSSSSIATITISNTDPSSASLSSNTINEGSSPGTAVGAITCTDVDNDVCSYTEYAPGHNGSSIFEISGTSIVLSSGQNLDFETDNSYNYSVLVDDGFGGDIYQEFNISVTDINEVPTDITPNSLNINENSPINSEVGTLTVTDSDSGDSHTFTELTGGTGESYFNISSSGVVEVEENSILNYESGTTSYTYEVRVTDSGSLT
ncbi:MAG: cadherin domain-containing protein, partial [Candidatus Woesearchaeota archaeon]